MAPHLALVPELEQELDDLFGRPLEDFTAARNALARRLRKAGQTDEAERVQALKKPSVPVWAVNQLSRRHGEEVRELVSAGERLRKAQQAAFGGGGTEAVREATTAERQAARTLTRRAAELLETEGRPATRPVVERVGALLRAAAVDPEASQLLAAGRLTEEVEATGFATVAEIAPAKPRAKPSTGPRRPDATERRRREQHRRHLRERRDQLRSEATAAEREADRLEREARKAREAAARARTAANRAEAELAADEDD